MNVRSDSLRIRLCATLEALAPFAAGTLLLGCGVLAAAHALGLGALPAGPLGRVTLPAALLVAGAGIGIVLASWETWRARRMAQAARAAAARAGAERDLALRQARRMRARAEGLALMREIHRSTALPERRDRLHRILTLVAELFEAREVTLFAARAPKGPFALGVHPAACLRTGPQEEVFVTFEVDGLERILEPPGVQASEAAAVRNASMAFEGCWLFAEGELWANGARAARAQWRRTIPAYEGGPPRQDAQRMLQEVLAELDYGPSACRHAAQALDQRRTIRRTQSAGALRAADREHGLLLCVPLLADQRPVGVLRIRRPAEGFGGPEAQAFEEMLIESAKHIALAMKKDEDDRKAITDQLTGLYIKRHFLSKLEAFRAACAASRQGGGGHPKSFALVMCDIDHFKQVNDTHGHLSGDGVLREVARVLRTGLRAGDIAFRYGGEELAILMPGASPNAAEQTAERLRQAVEKTPFHGEKGEPIPVTLSMGIAMHQPGLPGQELIARADRALYASKRGGRNRVTFWHSARERVAPKGAAALPSPPPTRSSSPSKTAPRPAEAR